MGIFVLLAGLLFFRVRAYLENSLFEGQSRRAHQVAETMMRALPKTGETRLVQEIEDLYAPGPRDRFLRITRSDGSVLYRSGPPADQSFDPGMVPLIRPSDPLRPNREEHMPDGRTLLVYTLRAATSSGGPYLIEAGLSAEPVELLVRHLIMLLSLGVPLITLVAMGGGYLLVRSALAPVEEIADKAGVITQHNLSERLPVPRTGDELEKLSIALNHMITRLDDAFGNSRRFVADASHELRTPIAIVQGELEALAKDPAAPPQFREQLGSLLEEVERLSQIVRQLFALSRLDAGEAHAASAFLDLASLAVATADQMAQLAEDKRIRLNRDSCAPVFVEGDPSRLKQVIVNLLDNAIKYTEPGGSVSIRTEARGGMAVLEIADTGIGISPEDLPHVFERFYRARQSRTGVAGGAGLGLSIVRSICGAHGGRVEVESALLKGSRFRVMLPLSQAPDSPPKQGLDT